MVQHCCSILLPIPLWRFWFDVLCFLFDMQGGSLHVASFWCSIAASVFCLLKSQRGKNPKSQNSRLLPYFLINYSLIDSFTYCLLPIPYSQLPIHSLTYSLIAYFFASIFKALI
jgi:hypothetical protein